MSYALGFGRWAGSTRRKFAAGEIPPPPIPPADFTFATEAEFNARQAAAVAGQIIELPADAPVVPYIAVTKSGIIVRGADRWSANLGRVDVINAQDVTLRSLPVQWTGSGNEHLISFSGNCNNYDVDSCNIRAGAPGTLADFITSFRTSVSNPYNIGTPTVHNATNALTAAVPNAIGQGTGATWSGSGKVRRCVVSDVDSGFRLIANGSDLAIDVYGNIMSRVYGVHMSVTCGGIYASSRYFRFRGNLLSRAFAQAQDDGNPHREFIGVFALGPNGTYVYGVLSGGNAIWMGPDDRGNGTASLVYQDGYVSPSPGPLRLSPYVAPITIDQFIIDRLSAGVLHGTSIGGYIGKCTVLANTEGNVRRDSPADNESAINPIPNPDIPAATVLNRNVFTESVPVPGASSLMLVEKNIAEAINADAYTVTSDNAVTNFKGTPATPYTPQFGVPAAGWAAIMQDMDLAAAHMQGTATNGLAGKGALAEGQTIAQLLDIWSQDTLPLARIPTFVAFTLKTQQLPGVTITSDYTPIVKLYEQDLPITLGGGGEIEIVDDPSGSGSTGWTSTPGTTGIGHKWMRRRGVSGANSTITAFTTQIGTGPVMTWQVGTVSSTARPFVAFERATPDIFRTAAHSLAAASPRFTFGLECRFPNESANSVRYFSNNNLDRFLVQLLTSQFLRISAGDGLVTLNTISDLRDGNIHRVLCSVDLTRTTIEAGVRLYVDDVKNLASSSTMSSTGTGTINWATSRQWFLGGNVEAAADARNLLGEHGFCYLFPDVFVELDDPANRIKFNHDVIGANGSGVTGTAPPIFLQATAAEYNAGTGNKGSGQPFLPVASAAVTDV